MITLEAAPSNKRQKQRLAKEFIKSVAKIMKMLEEAFYVFLKENASDNMGAGDVYKRQMLKIAVTINTAKMMHSSVIRFCRRWTFAEMGIKLK